MVSLIEAVEFNDFSDLSVLANEDVASEVVSPASSDSSAPLFDVERQQLTNSSLQAIAELEELDDVDVSIFEFEGDPRIQKRSLWQKCKTYPGDLLYPSRTVWGLFDLLIGGKLIKTTPYASVCYDDFGNKDSTACSEVSSTWINGSLRHTEHPTSVNAIFFGGNTCLPPSLALDSQEGCDQGAYPSYAVDATKVAHIQLAVNLARNLNLRLVVKNTGHCFLGKSMGKDALSIWTHNLKDILFLKDHREGSYSGPAFKIGAGVQAFELYETVNRYNMTVVGGEGKVGLPASALLQSPLLTLY